MERLLQEIILLAGTLREEILDILPYFLFGVALDAIIRTFKLHVKLRQSIEKMGIFAIPGAVIIGVISPLCACGILPIAISLLINGVPLAPVMALLVSSPLMSPSAYTLTAWELGQDWAIAKLIAAVFMGLFAGYVTLLFQDKYFNFKQLFKGEPPLHDVHDHDCDPKIKCTCKDKLSNRLAREGKNKFIVFSAKFLEGFITIGKYTMIGLLTEIIGLRYIPSDIINKVIYSKSLWMIPIVVFISIPLYVNQITAAAVLYGFIEKGMQIPWGVGMAFLVGGPVTALPVIAIFFSLFKRRVLYLYLGICVTGSLIVAYTFNFLAR
ncbi:MAG: permease [bacterium]|nr:permease [bacterium]